MEVGGTVAVALGEHGGEHIGAGGGRQAQVDEARAGDFHRRDEPLAARIGADAVGDAVGEFARIGAQRLGQLQRDVARDVAVRGLLGALQDDFRSVRAFRQQGADGVGQQLGDRLFVGGQHRKAMTPAVSEPFEIQFRRDQLRCSGKSTKFYQVSRGLSLIRLRPGQRR